MLLSNDQGSVPSTVKHPRCASAQPEPLSFRVHHPTRVNTAKAEWLFWGFFANGRLDGRPFVISLVESLQRLAFDDPGGSRTRDLRIKRT